MDWAGIEELVYSEASDPGRLLGEHVIKEGLLIQAFLPNAEKVSVKIGEEQFPMEMADENGFFAVLLDDRRELVPYHSVSPTRTGTTRRSSTYSYQSTPPLPRKRCGNSVRGSIMIPMRNWGTSGGGSRDRGRSLCGVGAGCDARQRCGRFQLLGRKTPPDEKARSVGDLRDLYPEPEARRDLQI